MKQPVTGYGTSGYIPAIKPELGPYSQTAHNSYLSVLVEEGLVGFILYITMIASVWLAVLRIPTLLERRFGLVLLATLAFAMMPLTWEDVKAVWFTLAVLAGFAQAYGDRFGRTVEPLAVPQFASPPRSRAARTPGAGVARVRNIGGKTAL
jgi:O-antigen ligase